MEKVRKPLRWSIQWTYLINLGLNMKKKQDKRELINKFVANTTQDDLTDKLATVKAVRKFDKVRFESAFNTLRLKR